MDEKVKEIVEKYSKMWFTSKQMKDEIGTFLSYISSLEARLDERNKKLCDYEHQLVEAGIRVSTLEARVRELEEGIKKHRSQRHGGPFRNDNELYKLIKEGG